MRGKAFDLAVTEFTEAVGLLVRKSRAAAATHELSWIEAGVLKRLAQDGSATTADLARSSGMRPQSMRPIVAGLEQGGMIERRQHATDGRQVNLVLTEKGAASWKSLSNARRTWLTQSIGQLERHEQETLFAAGKVIRRLLESSQA